MIGIVSVVTGLGFEPALVLGMMAIAILAFLLGLVIVRSPGIAFSMLSLAVNVGVYELLYRTRGATGGADGFSLQVPASVFGVSTRFLQAPQNMFVVVALVNVAAVAGLRLFEGTHLGRLTLAIRENPERAGFIGYRIYLPKVAIYVMSAMLCATGGALFAIYSGFISPESLHFMISGQALIMAMVGGTEAAWGPLLGAILFFLVRDQVTFLNDHWMLPLGVILIVVMAAWPTGLVGAVALLQAHARRFAGRKK